MFLSPFCVPFFTHSFLFVVKQLELGLRKDITEMLPAVACKESFSSIDPQWVHLRTLLVFLMSHRSCCHLYMSLIWTNIEKFGNNIMFRLPHVNGEPLFVFIIKLYEVYITQVCIYIQLYHFIKHRMAHSVSTVTARRSSGEGFAREKWD